MTNFMRFTRLSADSNSCNSLEGILTYADQDVAFIQERNWFYRFFAASTVTPDGDRVIAPSNITPPAPGRWIQQGAPGLVGPNPKQPMNLSDCGGGGSSPCLRGNGVLSLDDTLATFTFDVLPILLALEVPLVAGNNTNLVAARLQLIGLHQPAGNAANAITQNMPISLTVSSVGGLGAAYDVQTVGWSADIGDLATVVANGYNQNFGGAANGALINVDNIGASGTELTVEWLCASGSLSDNFLPGFEICGSSFTQWVAP